MTGCSKDCPFRRGLLLRKYINHPANHYQLKQGLFTNTNKLTLAPVSQRLEGMLKESFLRGKFIRTIGNGVDVSIFKPIEDINTTLNKYGLENIRYIVGVATAWSSSKGFSD